MEKQSLSSFGFGGCPIVAKNGLSIAEDNSIVLGQDTGDVNNPAVLLSNRKIPMAGHYIHLEDLNNVGGDNGETFFYGGAALMTQYDVFSSGINFTGTFNGTQVDLRASDNSRSFTVQVTPTITNFMMNSNISESGFSYQDGSLSIASKPSNFPPTLTLVDNTTNEYVQLDVNNPTRTGGVAAIVVPSQLKVAATTVNPLLSVLSVEGDIETADPLSGKGRWMLGQAITDNFEDVENKAAEVNVDGEVFYLQLMKKVVV